MKICLINLDFIPNRGSGQAVYAEKIALGLARRHEVTVICALKGDSPVEERFENLRIIRLRERFKDPSQWIGFGFRVAKFLRSWKEKSEVDIIHFLDAHVAYAYKGSFIASLHQSFKQRIAGDRGLPYSSSLLNLAKRYPYYLISIYLENIAIHKADLLLSVSETIRSEFICNYNVEPLKIHRVYNGIDTDFFKPVDPTSLRKRHHIADEKIILYIGFSTPRKGVETLTHALRYLKTKKVKLVIVGKWENGYRRKVMDGLGDIKKKIIEVGYIADADIPAYYSLADVFVLPSLLEGFGFPLVEAMSCGTPVISTNVGAIPEIVGQYGVIVPPQEPALLAKEIDSLFKNETLRKTLGKRSRTWVLNNFSERSMVMKTVDYYQELIDRKFSLA